MHDIFIFGGMLALCIWFIRHKQKEMKKHAALAEETIGKGIDLILPDGRRVLDDSVECTIPHVFIGHDVSFFPGEVFRVYSGYAEVIAFHRLKDGTWLRQDAIWTGKVYRNRSYAMAEEGEVRKMLATYPDQFTKAFGEPVVV